MIYNLLIIFSLLWLIACNENPIPDVTNCSDSYISNYQTIRGDFRKVYNSSATTADVEIIKSDISKFLASYDGVKCTSNGVTMDLTGELKQFLNDNNKGLLKLTNKIVYGTDDRKDVDDVTNSNYVSWAASTAAMIPNSNIDSSLSLEGETLGEMMNLCPGERFSEQITPAVCSGFLVRQDVLVTAGHCITDMDDCSSNKWVFGFKRGVTQLSEDNIYSCKSIIKRELEQTWGGEYGPDYAVIQLDRAVVGRTPLKFRSSGKIGSSTSIVVIGHPSGLPVKVADGAKVRSNKEDAYFVANLDTFGGNSGSAVFNASTGEVEGILVRGDTDYVKSGSCYKVNVCASDGCDGESVTRMTVVKGIPEQTGPVNGGWSNWNTWSVCTNNQQYRSRACNNPAPSDGGMDCVGDINEIRSCLTYSKDQIFDGIFTSQNFNYIKELINFRAHQEKDYMVLGKKFLGLCGMHVRRADNLIWLSEGVVECSTAMAQLDDVFLEFENLVLQ